MKPRTLTRGESFGWAPDRRHSDRRSIAKHSPIVYPELLGGKKASVSLGARHVRRVDLRGWEEIHVDDEVLTASPNAEVSIRIEPAALEILP